ncbi:tripartite tricarboxylate transporter TctB family protein [Falsihalocynthiibacter sp. S25ZX9]|uniref:tripartite tricarboxylate transporter TctB family protein n=1 Tax=Falsihalocynthiibacter sp. S25ZX9 TaxID=3240870 RepID=UPI00350F9214
MASDRIFGLVMALVALAYIAGATQIQTSFLPDPVGPKAFPFGVGILGALCALFMVFKPDAEPEWPTLSTFGAIAAAAFVLVLYAYALKPLGFLIPTAITAAILSYQISPRPKYAALAGLGLSSGLFIVFKFALGLGLVAFPKMIFG